MKERRNAQRKNLMAYSQVFDLYSGSLLGHLGDLHLEGAMVIGLKPLAENVEVTLAIELPKLPNINASRIAIPARAVWCQQDISPEFFNIGFVFKKVTAEQAAIIEAVMKNYELRRDAAP
ncbi:MAG: PilZ domain-containing protein [Chloroflexi bacterium]|nr:PilZ domain-containing protein [Chloroflexota bacterium]